MTISTWMTFEGSSPHRQRRPSPASGTPAATAGSASSSTVRRSMGRSPSLTVTVINRDTGEACAHWSSTPTRSTNRADYPQDPRKERPDKAT